MSKLSFLLLGLIFILLFSMCDAGKSKKRRRRSSSKNSNEYGNDNNYNNGADKYADDRLHANHAINHPDYTVGSEKSVTKQNWVYKHSPRSGSLFIRTFSGKVLYPGELNTIRNAIKFEDFLEDFYYKLPNAKANTLYSIVGYSDGYIAKALTNLRGEDLYQGTRGENLGETFKGLNKDEVGNLIAKDTKYCIEILEQNPNERITNYGNDETYVNPKHKWAKELSGTVGKTCFVVLPKGMQELDKDFYNEFELLIETFECHLDPRPNTRSGLRRSSSDVAVRGLDAAIERQRRASLVGNPLRNNLYTGSYTESLSDNPSFNENYQDSFKNPSFG